MMERLDCERVTMWDSAGGAAGQVILHYHVHSRYPADAPADICPRERVSADEIAAVAARLSG